jgi:hypothetical protein
MGFIWEPRLAVYDVDRKAVRKTFVLNRCSGCIPMPWGVLNRGSRQVLGALCLLVFVGELAEKPDDLLLGAS